MKCPLCDGTGKSEIGVGAFTIHGADCDRCNGKGIIEPMTNEEWFCSLPTEEKATFLAIQIRLGVEFYRTNDERYQNHAWWVKWLKEKHE